MTCEYVRARTTDEALEKLTARRGEAKLLAGGVALAGLMNQKLFRPTCLVDIAHIPALAGIRPTATGLRIGALVTHGELERSPLVHERVGLLRDMAKEIACGRIRNRGTIGGNLCHADPQEDPPAALLALGATVRFRSPRGLREVAIDQFFTDSFATVLAEDEVLEEVLVPAPPPGACTAYLKFGPRCAMDYASTISVAVVVARGSRQDILEDVTIGMSGVAPTPMRARATEAALRGQRLDPDVLDHLRRALAEEVDPAHDLQFSADYKRHAAGVLTQRAVQRAWERAARSEEARR